MLDQFRVTKNNKNNFKNKEIKEVKHIHIKVAWLFVQKKIK